jgi:hypothetical protein
VFSSARAPGRRPHALSVRLTNETAGMTAATKHQIANAITNDERLVASIRASLATDEDVASVEDEWLAPMEREIARMRALL